MRNYSNYNRIIRESKRRMNNILTNVMTEDVKEACPGILIITLSMDEYMNLMMLAEKGLNYGKRSNQRIMPIEQILSQSMIDAMSSISGY